MASDAISLFAASKKIATIAKDEASYRCAVSRAYYATYHRCRTYYAAMPYLSKTVGNGVHEQLINNLKSPSDKLSKNAKARSETLGKYLRVMCDARVKADYEPDQSFDLEEMEEALETAEIIFSTSAVTKGPI